MNGVWHPPHGMTLYYFPFRARAECLRMILYYGNIPFEDVIVPVDRWPALRDSTGISPFGQLPSLKLPDETIIAQTQAIAIYLAKMAGIYPSNNVDAAKADMIFDFACDLNMINPLLNFWSVGTDVWRNAHSEFFKALPSQLIRADRLLGNGPFYGGAVPHHGDFALFHILDSCVALEPECLDPFPRLGAYLSRIRELPRVREYIRSRLAPAEVGLCCSYAQAALANVYKKPDF